MRARVYRLVPIILAALIIAFAIILPTHTLAQESESVSISATVPANPSDYQLSITADPRDSRQSQGATIRYTITYGSNLTYATSPFTIQATILPGRILGATVPSLYVAEYVQGSASNAYMMTEPVFNANTNTLTWTVPTLPAQVKDQTVSFALRLNSVYTGADAVDFDVAVKGIAPDITINAVMQESYLYKSPTNQSTPTPTPQMPAKIVPEILRIQSNEITNTAATFTLSTNVPTRLTAQAISKDKKSILTTSIPTLSSYHRFTISKLETNTSYDIYILAKDADGQTVSSDTLQVHTTLSFTPITIDIGSLIISSANTIFYPQSYASTSGSFTIATIPTNTPYTFQIRVPDALRIIRIQGVISSASVLGASLGSLFDPAVAKEPEASTEVIDMTEISPSIFTGTVKTKPVQGLYDLRIRMTDVYGNISEHLIGTFSVIQPFTVLAKDSEQPIENARIFLSRYSEKTGRYVPLSPSFTSVQNPVFTKQNGEASFVLPYGMYTAVVSYLGTEETVRFSIDSSKHSGFPVVYIQPEPISAVGTIKQYVRTTLDAIVMLVLSVGTTIGSSQRLFETLSTTTLLLLFVVTILAFSSRTLIPIHAVPRYIVHAFHAMTNYPRSSTYISGTVIDADTRKPLTLCDVSIIEEETNTIATIVKTDTSGHYFFRVDPEKSYQIEIRKRGYERIEPVSFRAELSPEILVHALSRHHTDSVHDAIAIITRVIQTVLSACLELSIATTFILEVMMIRYYGFSEIFPYICVSLCTVVLWIAYSYHKRTFSTFNR